MDRWRFRPIFMMLRYFSLFMLLGLAVVYGQQDPAPAPPVPGTLKNSDPPSGNAPAEPEHKRLFGIVPNYRTSASLHPYKPLTTGQKFKIATQDSFDRGTFILAAAFAGESQLTRANPSFGNGAQAYGQYLGTSYADYVIGDYMTEAIYPTLFHQDPRYFRRGTGSVMSRIGYAIQQLIWTHTDAGGTQFNYSEIIGNSTAVAIGNAYYPDNRDAADAVSKLGTQIGVDGAANILKEFSPDIYRKFSRKHSKNP